MMNESIALGELMATINRQEIILKNCANPEEQFLALTITENLKQIKAQLTEYVKTPAFGKAVKLYQDSLKNKKSDGEHENDG